MAKILALTVVQHPSEYTPVVLRPGDDLPSWASKLVTNPEVVDQPEASGAEGTGEQTEPGSESSNNEDEPSRPDSSWKNDDIRDFAEEHQIDLMETNTKADMLELINNVLDLRDLEAAEDDEA